MQRAERFFERGYSTAAALMLVVILGLGAVALDSVKIASSSEAQLAQTGTTRCGPGAPAGARGCGGAQPTQQEICVNDSRIDIVIGSNADSQPQTRMKCWSATSLGENRLCPDAGTPPQRKPGCYVRFCAPRTATANDTSEERCTDEVYFENDSKMNASRPTTNMAAANSFASTVMAQGPSGQSAEMGTITSGMPTDTSKLIIGAFENQQEIALQQASIAHLEAQHAALECLAQSPSIGGENLCRDQVTAQSQAAAQLAQEQARLEQLRQSSQSLAGTAGGIQPGAEVPPPQGRDLDTCTKNTPGCPNTDAPTTFDRDRDRNQQPPPREQCSTLQRLIGGCNTDNGLFNNQTNSNVCVTSVYPVVIAPGPWRPGCLNSPPQNCSAIQQAISGCPNPYAPSQQTCSGLVALLKKCPAGSYNPNNPSNPYNYPAPTCNIQLSAANTGTTDQAVTLQWQSQYASYASLSNSGQVGPSGSMTVYPQGPVTYTMTVVGYGNQQGRCEARVGDAGGSGVAAQISCQPQVADTGMQVAVSWACQNSATSVGTVFSTGGALSGSGTTTVGVPALGSNSITYGLTCSNQGQTHSAQCAVNVNRVGIVLVANPKTIASGEESNIGWITSGMDACVVSSTNATFTAANASSTSVSGSAKTPALTQSTSFLLTCETESGVTKTASTTVTVQ